MLWWPNTGCGVIVEKLKQKLVWMIKVSFNGFETCKLFQGQFLFTLIVHAIMTPRKNLSSGCTNTSQWIIWSLTLYCSSHGNRRPPLFRFLFEQPFGYLVRGEQTNQITNVVKALFVYSDRTRTPETRTHEKHTLCWPEQGWILFIHKLLSSKTAWCEENSDSVIIIPLVTH